MRHRKKCTACEPPHMLDDLGRILPDDEVEPSLCPTAIRDVAQVLRTMGDRERELILEMSPPTSLASRIAIDEEGVEVATAGSGKNATLCLLAAIILLAGAILGALL